MSAFPTELEQRVADVVLGALKKDAAKGYVLPAEGRQAILKLFAGFTSREMAHAAAQELVRCAQFVSKNLRCPSAAVDLMNTFGFIVIPPVPPPVRVRGDDVRRSKARRLLALAPPPATDAAGDDGVPWWHVLK